MSKLQTRASALAHSLPGPGPLALVFPLGAGDLGRSRQASGGGAA